MVEGRAVVDQAGREASGPIGVGGDQGLMTTELVLLAPFIIVAFVALLLFGGRTADVGIELQTATQRAARAATMAADQTSAVQEARRTVDANLVAAGVECATPPVVTVAMVDLTGSGSRFAPGNAVEVTLTCPVDLSDLTTLAIPGTLSMQRDAIELIDVHRSGMP